MTTRTDDGATSETLGDEARAAERAAQFLAELIASVDAHLQEHRADDSLAVRVDVFREADAGRPAP